MIRSITSTLCFLAFAFSGESIAQSYGDRIAAVNAEPAFWEWSDCIVEIAIYLKEDLEDGRLEMKTFHRIEIEDAKCEAAFVNRIDQVTWSVDDEYAFAELLQDDFNDVNDERQEIVSMVAFAMREQGWDEVMLRGSSKGRKAKQRAEEEAVASPFLKP